MGEFIALSLLHGGEAPHCFSKAVSDFLVYRSVSNPSCKEMIRSMPDFEVQSKIEKISDIYSSSIPSIGELLPVCMPLFIICSCMRRRINHKSMYS